MFSIKVACKVKAGKRAVEDCALRLQEEIAGTFDLGCLNLDVEGADSLPDRGIDVSMWFSTKSMSDYDPVASARVAERIADETRVMTRGKASGVSVCFWDSSGDNRLDEYIF